MQPKYVDQPAIPRWDLRWKTQNKFLLNEVSVKENKTFIFIIYPPISVKITNGYV